MQDRAEGLEKRAATGDAQQLPPGTTTRMAIGPEIAPADPAPIGTGWVGAEMRGGIYRVAGYVRGTEQRGRGVGASELGALACSQASQCGFFVRPAKDVGS